MDATDHKWKVPPALAGDDSRFQRLLDVLPAAAYTCDADGLITYYNKHAAELWGREPKLNDPVDRFCGSLRLYSGDGAPISHAECWMALAMRRNQEYKGCEVIVERPDGDRRTVLAHANPFHDDVGKPTGAVNIMVDISDHGRAETALRDVDRRINEFLAMLAHEPPSPLAPIRSALHLLRRDTDEGVALEQTRAMMERQLLQMVRLVDDLVDVARIANNQLVLCKARVELATVLQVAIEAARPFIEECGHELVLTLPPEPIYLEADQARLAQAFCSLLDNASKYTERGGPIWLTAKREGHAVFVTVHDGGIGIPAGMLRRIFDLFTRVDGTMEQTRGGLGLGLSLARAQVEMHGGDIEARSEGLGKGSEFVIRLPLLLEPIPADPQPAYDVLASGSRRTCRVLVVDDNRDAAMALALVLQHLGNETRMAHDGPGAVQAAEEFRPDAVLLDHDLPIFNGDEVARKIRERPWGPAVYLIAVTGWGQDEDRRRSAEAGFDLHLVKPLDHAALETLLAGLRNQLPRP
ncbi:MAG: ATP-binding protein [Candidatus Eisenbacteria bacterium]